MPSLSGWAPARGHSTSRALAAWSSSLTWARVRRTSLRAPVAGRIVSVTTEPLGPRTMATTWLTDAPVTSTGGFPSCAIATMWSPSLSAPLSAAGPPGTTSRIVHRPSTMASVTPMPTSDRFNFAPCVSIDSLLR